jgi:hypothetical protein
MELTVFASTDNVIRFDTKNTWWSSLRMVRRQSSTDSSAIDPNLAADALL